MTFFIGSRAILDWTFCWLTLSRRLFLMSLNLKPRASLYVSSTLKSLKGGIWRSIVRLYSGDTRSLDFSSCIAFALWMTLNPTPRDQTSEL